MLPVGFLKLGDFQDTGAGVFVHLHIGFSGQVIQGYVQDVSDLAGNLNGGLQIPAFVTTNNVPPTAPPTIGLEQRD